MGATKENIDEIKDPKESKGQGNSESIDRKRSSDNNKVDNGENQVSNGTESRPSQPGIAKVGNTGTEESE